MTTYHASTQVLIRDEFLASKRPGATFTTQEAQQWFKRHYGDLRPHTIRWNLSKMEEKPGSPIRRIGNGEYEVLRGGGASGRAPARKVSGRSRASTRRVPARTTRRLSTKDIIRGEFADSQGVGATFTTQDALRWFERHHGHIALRTVRWNIASMAREGDGPIRRVQQGVYEVIRGGGASTRRATRAGSGRSRAPNARASNREARTGQRRASSDRPPVWRLMHEFASTRQSQERFRSEDVVRWFAENYPDVSRGTVIALFQAMAVNNPGRVHHSSVRPGNKRDLFYNEGQGRYRLWNKRKDPKPIYRERDEAPLLPSAPRQGAREFSNEEALQVVLARDPGVIEPGLRLWRSGADSGDESSPGVEFDTGQGRIDILAVDRDENLVVIELKASKVKSDAVGQILGYIGWVKDNLADRGKEDSVRGIIVGSHMHPGVASALRQARARVEVKEYALTVDVKDAKGARSALNAVHRRAPRRGR